MMTMTMVMVMKMMMMLYAEWNLQHKMESLSFPSWSLRSSCASDAVESGQYFRTLRQCVIVYLYNKHRTSSKELQSGFLTASPLLHSFRRLPEPKPSPQPLK